MISSFCKMLLCKTKYVFNPTPYLIFCDMFVPCRSAVNTSNSMWLRTRTKQEMLMPSRWKRRSQHGAKIFVPMNLSSRPHGFWNLFVKLGTLELCGSCAHHFPSPHANSNSFLIWGEEFLIGQIEEVYPSYSILKSDGGWQWFNNLVRAYTSNDR